MRFKPLIKMKDSYYEEIIIADNNIQATKIAKFNNRNSEIINSTWTYK